MPWTRSCQACLLSLPSLPPLEHILKPARLPTPPTDPVCLLAGISPIKALIESGALQAGQRRDVRLYYGARSPAHLAYASSIPSWEAAGVKVIPVFSEQGGGYVQDAFSKVGCRRGAVVGSHRKLAGRRVGRRHTGGHMHSAARQGTIALCRLLSPTPHMPTQRRMSASLIGPASQQCCAARRAWQRQSRHCCHPTGCQRSASSPTSEAPSDALGLQSIMHLIIPTASSLQTTGLCRPVRSFIWSVFCSGTFYCF